MTEFVVTIINTAMKNSGYRFNSHCAVPSLVICRTAVRIKAMMTRRLKEFGVTPEQWGVLAALREEDGITQKELSCRIFKDQPNTTRILDKLVGKELVRRAGATADRRAFLVHLTAKGREMHDRLLPAVLAFRVDIVKGLTAEEVGTLLRLLDRVGTESE